MTTATPAPAPVPRRTGYAELTAEIRSLGLMRRRPDFYVPLILLNLSALAAVVTVMVVARGSWWLVLLAAAFAVVSAQIAFVGHDSGHRQLSRRSGPSRLLGLLHANLLNGLSYGWWVDKHNAHHAHPNDLETDPDVRAGVLIFDVSQTRGRSGLAAFGQKIRQPYEATVAAGLD